MRPAPVNRVEFVPPESYVSRGAWKVCPFVKVQLGEASSPTSPALLHRRLSPLRLLALGQHLDRRLSYRFAPARQAQGREMKNQASVIASTLA